MEQKSILKANGRDLLNEFSAGNRRVCHLTKEIFSCPDHFCCPDVGRAVRIEFRFGGGPIHLRAILISAKTRQDAMPSGVRSILTTLTMIVGTLTVTAVLGEAMLRLKNADQRSYFIEMWRYAGQLKQISPDELLGHVHIPSTTAQLQGVNIAINRLGMRGPEIAPKSPGDKRVLLLGSSIALGWGVPEEKTIRSRLEENLPGWTAYNGGIGNYNVARSVRLFEQAWRNTIRPDVVVVHFFLRDAEFLPPSRENFIVRHSQFAVTLYHIANGFLEGRDGVAGLINHYRAIYDPSSRGFKDMIIALDRLNEIAKEDGFKVILAVVPDIHQLRDYPFGFAHERVKALAKDRGWQFLDFLDVLGKYQGPELWAMPGDPHPNAVAHGLMADALAQLFAPLR